MPHFAFKCLHVKQYETERHSQEFGWIGEMLPKTGSRTSNQILSSFVLFWLREALIKSVCLTSINKKPCPAFI